MQLTDKQLKAKAQLILREHEDILKYIIEEEKNALNREDFDGKTQFEIAKKAIKHQGIKQGMEKVLRKLNEYSRLDV